VEAFVKVGDLLMVLGQHSTWKHSFTDESNEVHSGILGACISFPFPQLLPSQRHFKEKDLKLLGN
jgi:hypothetical protein